MTNIVTVHPSAVQLLSSVMISPVRLKMLLFIAAVLCGKSGKLCNGLNMFIISPCMPRSNVSQTWPVDNAPQQTLILVSIFIPLNWPFFNTGALVFQPWTTSAEFTQKCVCICMAYGYHAFLAY